MVLRAVVIIALTLAGASAGVAQKQSAQSRFGYGYPDLADLALPGSVAAQVRIREAIALKGPQAANVPGGRTRYYVTADVMSLIRGSSVLPARISYLADLPNAADPASKPRRRGEYLVLGDPVPGRTGELRLTAADAHIPWTDEVGNRIRALAKEAAAPGAAPQIVGVGKAFHVPGSLPGESETQLFLLTADGRPISISILRRPHQRPHWAVALGEIVDEAAAPPAPNSLLWYRLACTLPARLPQQSIADADPAGAAAIRADYALVMEGLGPCIRNRARGS